MLYEILKLIISCALTYKVNVVLCQLYYTEGGFISTIQRFPLKPSDCLGRQLKLEFWKFVEKRQVRENWKWNSSVYI